MLQRILMKKLIKIDLDLKNILVEEMNMIFQNINKLLNIE